MFLQENPGPPSGSGLLEEWVFKHLRGFSNFRDLWRLVSFLGLPSKPWLRCCCPLCKKCSTFCGSNGKPLHFPNPAVKKRDLTGNSASAPKRPGQAASISHSSSGLAGESPVKVMRESSHQLTNSCRSTSINLSKQTSTTNTHEFMNSWGR